MFTLFINIKRILLRVSVLYISEISASNYTLSILITLLYLWFPKKYTISGVESVSMNACHLSNAQVCAVDLTLFSDLNFLMIVSIFPSSTFVNKPLHFSLFIYELV